MLSFARGRFDIDREFYAAAIRCFPFGDVAVRDRAGAVLGLSGIHLPGSKQRFLRLRQQSSRQHQRNGQVNQDQYGFGLHIAHLPYG